MTRNTSRRVRSKLPVSAVLRRLAWFRYHLRQFLRFSERETRARGVTPQQYLLLLGIAGFTGRGWATIGEMAEFLQERHNAVVGLVQRAARRGLVRKGQSSRDRRYVRVRLSRQGMAVLQKLAQLHFDELKRIRFGISNSLLKRPQVIKAVKGS